MLIRIIKPYNTKGLDADAKIFYECLKSINPNWDIKINSENELKNYKKVDDVHIYVSNTDVELLKYAKIKMFMINHELFLQKESDLNILKNIDYILARNQTGFDFANKVKNMHNLKYKVVLIKFKTLFPVIDIDKIWNVVLHSAGEHHWKQTDTIIKCWNKYDDLIPIVITCTDQCYRNIKNLIDPNKKNILIYNELLPSEKFIELKNKIGIHLCPSIVEGFGHYINEARKVKSLVITSNMGPMNEMINSSSGFLINCDQFLKKKNNSDLCIINEDNMYNIIKEVVNTPLEKRKDMIDLAYKNYEDDSQYFYDKMKDLFENLT